MVSCAKEGFGGLLPWKVSLVLQSMESEREREWESFGMEHAFEPQLIEQETCTLGESASFGMMGQAIELRLVEEATCCPKDRMDRLWYKP